MLRQGPQIEIIIVYIKPYLPLNKGVGTDISFTAYVSSTVIPSHRSLG